MEDWEGLLELDKSEGIYIDIGTQVYLNIEGVTYSVTSIFVGLLKDEFMIITLPRRYKSVKNKLFASNKMVVKYLHDGSAYAFQSSIIEMITTPIKALAIEYPKVVQKRELRSIKRANVVIPGRIEAKKVEFPIVIFDLSKNGCRFQYQEQKTTMTTFREGDLMRIFCKFPGVASEVGALAVVRNIKREKNILSIGAAFQDLNSDFLTPLMRYLFDIEDFI